MIEEHSPDAPASVNKHPGAPNMGRSRYVITEPGKPHFLTCTVVEWLPVFTRPDAVHILLDSWTYLRQHDGLRLLIVPTLCVGMQQATLSVA